MAEKEAAIQVLLKRKWEARWIMLFGGAIYFKKKADANEVKGPYALQGADVQTSTDYKKKLRSKLHWNHVMAVTAVVAKVVEMMMMTTVMTMNW